MQSDRQRLLVWSIPVATLLVFLLLSWHQRDPRDDARVPEEPGAEVQAVLRDALERARRIRYAFERDRMLLGVSAGFARSGETGAALRAATMVTRAPLRAQAFFLVVHALVKEGKADEAGTLLPRIRQPDLQAGAAALVLSARLRAGQAVEARRLAESGMSPGDRRRLWEAVAARRPGPNGIEPVMRLVDGLAGEDERDWALAGVARGLAKRGRVRLAAELAERIRSDQARISAQWGVAGGQARVGDLGGALLTASDLPPQRGAQAAAVSEIAKAYVAAGDLEGALNMADLLADAGERACVLRAVAVTQAASGDGEAGFRTSLRIADMAERSRAQVEVAHARAEGGDVAGAWRLAARIDEGAARARALGDTAAAHGSARGFQEAMRRVAGLPQGRGMKAVLYAELAAARARMGDSGGAVAMAGDFEEPSEQAMVLIGAARGLLERARKIERSVPVVACERPSRTVDVLLRPVDLERLVEGDYTRS